MICSFCFFDAFLNVAAVIHWRFFICRPLGERRCWLEISVGTWSLIWVAAICERREGFSFSNLPAGNFTHPLDLPSA